MEKPTKFLKDQGTFNTLFSELKTMGIDFNEYNKGSNEEISLDDYIIKEFEKRKIPITPKNIIRHQEIAFAHYFMTSFKLVTSAAKTIFDLEESEFTKNFQGFQIESWINDPIINAYCHFEDTGKFSIQINLALIRFCIDVITTLSGITTVVDDNGDLVESPILTMDDAVSNIHVLMKFYFQHSDKYVSSNYVHDIGKQLKFNGQFHHLFIITIALQFITAHEIGHFILYKNYNNPVLKAIKAQASDISCEAINAFYRKDLEKISSSIENIQKSWDQEFAADLIAYNILFKRGNNYHNFLIFDSIQTLFQTYMLLDGYFEKKIGKKPLSKSHPPIILRYFLTQELAFRELDDDSYKKILLIGDKGSQFFHDVLERIND
ncbi:MAG: hypothetical protein NTZ37_09315 [Methanoregula sp.]|nr:hypothetical protein [Methanoregula sp.]